MSYVVISYLIYLAITVITTILVAKNLFSNGKVFLVDIFHGNTELAIAVNNLLLAGFYLINIGYAVYTLRVFETIVNAQELIEVLSIKTGAIILILGGMHFGNMFIFFKLRKKTNEEKVREKIIKETHY